MTLLDTHTFHIFMSMCVSVCLCVHSSLSLYRYLSLCLCVCVCVCAGRSQVWVEVFVPSLGRYVHADPCEKSLDAPLTYEAGWNKKLSYIFSFSRFGVTDVIHRYSRKFTSTVCHSRSLCTEKFVRDRVKRLDIEAQSWYCQQLLLRQSNTQATAAIATATAGAEGCALTLARLQQGISSFFPSHYSSLNVPSDLSLSDLIARKTTEQKDLRMLMFLQSTQLSPAELQGRISGDKDWKESRGEAGTASAAVGGGGGGGVPCREVAGMQWLREVSIAAEMSGLLSVSCLCSCLAHVLCCVVLCCVVLCCVVTYMMYVLFYYRILQSIVLASCVEGGEGGGKLDISVSSVANDDVVDNPSNKFTSDLSMLHARWIATPEGKQ
jgi:hypothetical protein